MQIYSPKKLETPKNLIDVPSAWKGLEKVLADIIERFSIGKETALEFGVEYGYSIVALSNYFAKVIGVDHFQGDEHTKNGQINMEKVLSMMPENTQLVSQSYQEFIKENNEQFNLIHIDIVHTYEDTFTCGDWAMQHSPIVIFHDTVSFPGVLKAVEDLAKKYNVEFYNYPFHHGLGILCQNSLS